MTYLKYNELNIAILAIVVAVGAVVVVGNNDDDDDDGSRFLLLPYMEFDTTPFLILCCLLCTRIKNERIKLNNKRKHFEECFLSFVYGTCCCSSCCSC